MRVLADDWGGGCHGTDPCMWWVHDAGALIDRDTVDRLIASFPTAGFARRDRSDRLEGKRYRNESRPVASDANSADLPLLWRNLIADLESHAYSRKVAALLDQDIAEDIEVRFSLHHPGDWLDPHVDGADKLFTQLFYLNQRWEERFGGALEILHPEAHDRCCARIIPSPGRSVILRREETAWHRVSAVTEHAPEARRSLLVHGLRARS